MHSGASIGRARARGVLGLGVALLALAVSASLTLVARAPGPAGAAVTSGYWLMGTDGGVFSFGRAGFYGSTGEIPLNQPIVGTASTPSGRGYWMVAADGGIFAFGDAAFYGSMGGKPLNKPVVAMAPTRSGKGYWLVAADGGMFAFGDAGFYGSMGGSKLNKPVVDMAATPSGRGYWLAATDGGIFAFGDAAFYGSTGNIDLAKRIHALSATPGGRGYWLVAGDGGIFAFGDAGYFGSAAGGGAEKRVIDMAPSASGKGYYVTTSEGQVLGYGDAKDYGDTTDIKLNHRIVAMTAMNGNEPPVAVDNVASVDEDGMVSVDVLANDRDPEGGPLTLRSVATPARGRATAVGNTVLYRPNPDYHGPDSFRYTVANARGDTALGRVNVTVRSVNDVPEAVDDTVVVPERVGAVVSVLANDAGLGDGIKSVSVSSGPTQGSARVNTDWTITYLPDEDHIGNDSFEYKVTDTDGESSTARVRITVVDVNDIPVANDDFVSSPAGRSLRGIDVQANDFSPDGFRSLLPVDPSGTPVDSDDGFPTDLGGTFERDKGKLNYFPPRGVTGTDTFRYVIVDGRGADDPHGGDMSSVATVHVSLAANGAPRIVRDAAFSVAAGATVRCDTIDECLAKVVEDPEGDRLRFTLRRAPSARIDLRSDGTFTYGPAGAAGEDRFTFVADDGNQESEEGTVTITITPPPQGPQPQSDPSATATTAAVLMPLGPAAAWPWAQRWRRRPGASRRRRCHSRRRA